MKKPASIVLAFSLAAAGMATLVPKGTDVRLAFVDDLSSKTAHVGDKVKFTVVEDVLVDGQLVIKKGTQGSGTVRIVERGRRFGVNARIRIDLDPIAAADGTLVPLSPRNKGKKTGGGTDRAAIASGAAAIVLGPVGLGVGYFMTGREVTVHSGDTLSSEVSKPTDVNSSVTPTGVHDAGQRTGRP